MWWLALAGAAAGQISYSIESRKQQEEITRQRKQAQRAYELEKAYSNANFNLQKSEALDSLGTAKNRLAESLNFDMASFNHGLENQAFENQGARISLADSTGMALAAQGASGVRGSGSMQQQIDYHERQFNRQMDMQSRGNSLALQGMATQYTNQFYDIGREIDSWGEGGYRSRAKALSDQYASNMHQLNMDEYTNAYDSAGWNFVDFLVAGLSGGGQGASFGMQVENYRKQKG